jgi:hypothetical protein
VAIGPGVSSGAAAGAGAGSAFGPWGAVIGGVVGAFAGLSGDRDAAKAAKQQKQAIRAYYREKFRQSAIQLTQTLGSQRVGYAASGVDVGSGSAKLLLDTTKAEFANTQQLMVKQRQAALEGAQVQNDFWGTAGGLVSAAASVYGAAQIGGGKGGAKPAQLTYGGPMGVGDYGGAVA